MMTEILELLERDATLSAAEIAERIGHAEAEVAEELAKIERDGTIAARVAVVDWDRARAREGGVAALIEVKISPQRGEGYDRIAERIARYDEVESLYLMSGSFDLAVMIRARNMREVSEFVFAHLATIDGVTSTATHFIMKRYKERHMAFEPPVEQEERGLFV
ncbi:MAG: Lrp/AsnC family transcriptional regulator [Oscillospiraceae bacterium]|jgi:DNA-binding Lrp family transcriptional regulator|nr:Lrp/AsnC family transcriptional regulator [Oscillospiraceae bacterium]